MPVNFLDETGFSYFWTKLKTYISNLLSSKADDNAVVHNTGDETISGYKLFSDDIELKIDYNKGDSLSSNKASFLIVHDKNGIGNPYRLGGLQLTMRTDGATDYRMLAFDNVSGSSNSAVLGLRSTSDGYRYAYASQTPTAFTDNSNVLTYSWIPYDTRIVHCFGAETLGGVKTFGNTPVVPGMQFRRNDAPVKGSPVTVDYSTSMTFYDSSGNTGSAYAFGNIEVREYTNMTNIMALRAYKNEANSTDYAIIVIGYMPNGTKYTEVNNIWPAATNSYSCGSAQRTWREIYSQSGTVIASDGRMKDAVSAPPGDVLDAWEGVEWVQYKLTDSIARKGGSARLHSGLVAQQIEGAFADRGLDASKYGLFCYDSWEARDWDEKVVDRPESVRTVKTVLEDGTLDVRDVVEPEKFHMERRHEDAGGRYSLRYEEALCMEAAYMRRENARLKKRVADLEERLAALELKAS